MYSPKELEGEVDHSFFDSDCEANGAEDGWLNGEASQRPDERRSKETPVLKDQTGLEVQSGENRKDKARLEDGLHQESKRGNNKEKQCIKEGQSSDVLFSPIPSAKSSETGSNSQSDEESSVQSYSSDEERELDDEDNGVFKQKKNSNVHINSDDDDDGYHRSNDESDEDDGSHSSKHREPSRGTPKKFAGKFHNLSRSYSSSSDPESSHSSEEGSSVYSEKSQVKHLRVGSAHQRDRPKESGESEDTVTDVTPLSTPNVSPAQSIDIALPSEPLAADVQQDVQENEEDSEEQASISSEGEDEPAFCEKQLDRVLVSSHGRVGSSRKNYSFTNEEVRRIDRENQRLLNRLSHSSALSRSGSSMYSSTSSHKSGVPPVRLYHSALNRQKEQERIQKENMAFLKRLESVKATPGLTRDEQLADYQRQCGYLGMHVTPIPSVKPKYSKTSASTSRPCSSPHKARPETAKSSRATPRPAWS